MPRGPGVGAGSRMNKNKNMTQDFGANLKWEATDRLRFNFDAQYVDSEIDNYDISIEHHSFANTTLDAFDEALRRGLKVVDAAAFSLCQENRLPMLVFAAEGEDTIARAVAGEKIGTLITVETPATGG